MTFLLTLPFVFQVEMLTAVVFMCLYLKPKKNRVKVPETEFKMARSPHKQPDDDDTVAALFL